MKVTAWQGRLSEPHDVKAGVDENDVAGDATAEIAPEEDSRVGDFRDIGVSL